jgi:hypothetical protein
VPPLRLLLSAGLALLPVWAGDQRGMDMIVAEEVSYLKDGASGYRIGRYVSTIPDKCD